MVSILDHSNTQPKPLPELAKVACVHIAVVVEVEGDRRVGTKRQSEQGKVAGVDIAVAIDIAEEAVKLEDVIVAGC